MTNHNQLPDAQPTLTDKEQSVFSLDTLSEWRSRQYSILSGLREADNFSNTNYIDDFNASIETTLNEFLSEKNITPDSPNYDEIRALFREASIDNITEDEWGNSPASRGVDSSDTKSQSDIFGDRIAERLRGSLDGDDVDMDALHQEALVENARFNVDVSREEWATASAKRQGKAFSFKNKERDTVRDTYHENVQKLGIMELSSEISDDDDDTTKNAKVIAWLFEEQAKLRELTTEKLQNTKVGKFVNFMNKGSRKARFMKAVGLGVVAGVGGSLVAGAAGAAVVAAGAAGASRFVRGYVRGDNHRGMATAQEEFIDSNNPVELENTEHDSIETRLNDAAGSYNEAFEHDTKLEQKKRRRALAFGVGSVALGATLGYALTNIDEIGDIKDNLQDKWHNYWNEDNFSSTPNNTGPIGPEAPTNQTTPDTSTNGGDGHPDIRGEQNADMYNVSVDSGNGLTHEWMDFAEANGQHLTPGQAFRLHEAIVDKFGADYIDLNGQGADIYMQDGDIRLAHPAEGRWKQGVPEFTVKWMQDNDLWTKN